MTTERVYRNAEGEGKLGSSRDLVCSRGCCEALAEDFGIALTDVVEAFEGEPMKRALRVCAWAEGTGPSPIERGRALSAWAKKHGSGVYRTERGPEPRSGARHVKAPRREKFTPEQILRNLERMGA